MVNIEYIREMFKDKKKAKSVSYIEECIYKAGARPLRGDTRQWQDSDDKLAMIQEPRQLAKFMVYLSSMQIKKYIEVGVASGSTFLFLCSYMREMCDLEEATAVDIAVPHKLIKVLESDQMPYASFLLYDSRSLEFGKFLNGREFELAFIDGSHEYVDVMEDYRLLKDRSGALAFHDIVCRYQPGVVQAWNEIREENSNKVAVEFIDQSHDRCVKVAGIGLIHIRREK